MSWLRNAALIALATAMLMGVAVIDRHPSAFTDTAFYYSQGEAAAHALGLAPRIVGAGDPTSVVDNDRAAAPTELDAYIGARSPFYGLLLYGATRVGGLWLVVALQALAAAVVLFIATSASLPRRPAATYAAAIAALGLGASLPFLTAFAMPDVFAGLAALSAITLLAFLDRLSGPARITLWLTLTYALTCHGAYPPVVAVILALGLFGLWRQGVSAPQIVWRGAVVASALAVALLAGWTAGAAHSRATGHDQRQPPFLTARVLADGPGRLYLRQVCAARPPPTLALCAFKARPLDDTEDFLWADDPRDGVFSVTDAGARRAIEDQEPGFVAAAVLAHPLREAAAAAANAGRQLLLVYVDDPLRNPADIWTSPYFARTRLTTIIPGMAACRAAPARCASPIPLPGLRILDQAAALTALVFIGGRLSRADLRRPPARRGGRAGIIEPGLALADRPDPGRDPRQCGDQQRGLAALPPLRRADGLAAGRLAVVVVGRFGLGPPRRRRQGRAPARLTGRRSGHLAVTLAVEPGRAGREASWSPRGSHPTEGQGQAGQRSAWSSPSPSMSSSSPRRSP